MRAAFLRCANAQAAAQEAAEQVKAYYNAHQNALVTLAAGFTPLACYELLISMQNRKEIDLKAARYVGLDEWLGLDENDEGGCMYTMKRAFYEPAGIEKDKIRAFDGAAQDLEAEAAALDGCIALAGGLSLAVLGIGLNGHVGFNEPRRTLRGNFSLTPLSRVTQEAGRKYFGGQAAPQMGATITLEALLKAEKVVLIATGAHKKAVMERVLQGDEDAPAAAFLSHPGAVFIVDEECCP